MFIKQLGVFTRGLITKASVGPYHIPRNSQGSLPVYSDVRNAGSRYLILVRGVQGNVNVGQQPGRLTPLSDLLQALAQDLGQTLYEPGSQEAARLRIKITQSNHLVLSGGNKKRVVEWMLDKGF